MTSSVLRNELKRIILSECRLEDQDSTHAFRVDDQEFYVPRNPKEFIQNVLNKIEEVNREKRIHEEKQ